MPEQKTFYEKSYKHGGEFKAFEKDSDFLEREEGFCSMRVLMKHLELDVINDDLLVGNHKVPNEKGEFLTTESFDSDIMDIYR